MKCSDLQFNLSLYADAVLDEEETRDVAKHLDLCPLCRQSLAELRDIRFGLGQIRRPEIPSDFRNALRSAIDAEIRNRQHKWLPFSAPVREWLQMRFMPYSVGVFSSVVIALIFLTMMFSKVGPFTGLGGAGDPSAMLASDRHPSHAQSPSDIAQLDYARSRSDFASESPSVNPQGALIALTKSLVRGGMKDDEVVVVADVFGNGLAQIAEVIEPSRNRQAVGELEKALDSDPALAPFVAAGMENRPDSMRVVLKFQNVNVSTGSAHVKRRHKASA